MLRVGLRAVADAVGDVGEQDGAGVGQARGERLLFHEVGEDAGVARQPRERDAVVRVDGDDFALVGGEFFCVALLKCVEWSAVKIIWRRVERS